jgi:hydrogenase expression/formation protein HypE
LGAREGLPVGDHLISDCRNLFPLCEALFSLDTKLKFLRDATRGGAAAVLNEIVSNLQVGIFLREADIPINADVEAAADILGLNPLEVANEGVFIAVVAEDAAERAVKLLNRHAGGEKACVAGTVVENPPGKVYLETKIGGKRMVDSPRGLLLPRIC